MILQELIEAFAKPRRRNTTLTIEDSNYHDLCICPADDVPEEYLNLVLIDWDFESTMHDDGESLSLSIDLEVRVEC